MAPFSYTRAMEEKIINESDTKRLACIMMHLMDDTAATSGLNWDACAKDFGAAPGGFRKMYQNALKKLRDAKCYYDVGVVEDADATEKKPAATSRKRKVKDTSDEEKPAKKAKGGRGKKATIKTEEVEEEPGEEDEVEV